MKKIEKEDLITYTLALLLMILGSYLLVIGVTAFMDGMLKE